VNMRDELQDIAGALAGDSWQRLGWWEWTSSHRRAWARCLSLAGQQDAAALGEVAGWWRWLCSTDVPADWRSVYGLLDEPDVRADCDPIEGVRALLWAATK
jgi:hypothetical protein